MCLVCKQKCIELGLARRQLQEFHREKKADILAAVEEALRGDFGDEIAAAIVSPKTYGNCHTKRPRLADLPQGAEGSCTERMNIEAAASARPAAGHKEPCEACAKANNVLHATACYHVFDADGNGEVLCPECYAAREAALATTGGCMQVTRFGSRGQRMLSVTRGAAVATAADEAEYRKLRAGVAAAAKKGVMGPVQGGRTQLTHAAANLEMRTAMAAAISNRKDAVNKTACSLLRPNQAPTDVHTKELEIVNAQATDNRRDAESGKGANETALLPLRDSKSDPGVVRRQSVHVEPMPQGGCQTFILLRKTDVHTMVYDTSLCTVADVVRELCPTAEQRKCPRWLELVAVHKDLLAAGLLARPTPALVGTLPAGSVIAFASGLPHFGRELPCASTREPEYERGMLIFSATLEASAEEALAQTQLWDVFGILGCPEAMFALCQRDAMLRQTLLADAHYFKTRTRNTFSNGKPELTWTPEMWNQMFDCVQDRQAPSAFLSNQLREQARFMQLNNGDGNEPRYWCNFWTYRGSDEPITEATRWHEWRLRDSPGGEDSSTVLLRLGGPWESEVFHVQPGSCSCTVRVYEVDAKKQAGPSLREVGTFRIDAGQRVRIVPTAVDVAAGRVLMSRWTEDKQGEFGKWYMCFGRLGEEMDSEGDTVDCDECGRQITEARFLEHKTGVWCRACTNSAPADAKLMTEALAVPSKRFAGCGKDQLIAELTRLGVKGVKSKPIGALMQLIDEHSASPAGCARNRLY